LAPIYYLIFLWGWQVGPHITDGPCWFTYEKGFNNCSQYWWSVFTFTINFVPGYSIANEGCYYWGWFPACDLQLFLVVPWFIYAFYRLKQSYRNIGIALGVFGGMVIIFWVIWHNQMAAGLFAPQDVAIFRLFVNKPYTKLYAVFLGIQMAFFYKQL
jgi:hypothetical protein